MNIQPYVVLVYKDTNKEEAKVFQVLTPAGVRALVDEHKDKYVDVIYTNGGMQFIAER